MLGGLEQLIGMVHRDALLPKASGIFKVLYDSDILEEEVLLDWAKKGVGSLAACSALGKSI